MKIKFPKKINLKLVAFLLFFIAILLEGYLVFSYLYPAIQPKEGVLPGKIIKVDRTGFNEVSAFLAKLPLFQPTVQTFTHPNPFKYSQ